MNKAAIKKELRRSACEDEIPFMGVGFDAACIACDFQNTGLLYKLDEDDMRTFFLLVAEAL